MGYLILATIIVIVFAGICGGIHQRTIHYNGDWRDFFGGFLMGAVCGVGFIIFLAVLYLVTGLVLVGTSTMGE